MTNKLLDGMITQAHLPEMGRIWVSYPATGRIAYLPRRRAEQMIAQGRAVPHVGGRVSISQCRVIGGDGERNLE